jgi:hypothetical protein
MPNFLRQMTAIVVLALVLAPYGAHAFSPLPNAANVVENLLNAESIRFSVDLDIYGLGHEHLDLDGAFANQAFQVQLIGSTGSAMLVQLGNTVYLQESNGPWSSYTADTSNSPAAELNDQWIEVTDDMLDQFTDSKQYSYTVEGFDSVMGKKTVRIGYDVRGSIPFSGQIWIDPLTEQLVMATANLETVADGGRPVTIAATFLVTSINEPVHLSAPVRSVPTDGPSYSAFTRILGDEDSDRDSLSDLTERAITGTQPYDADTDDDGYADGVEVRSGYNPWGRGTIDSDNDGYTDNIELKYGYNPFGPGKRMW